MPIICRFLSCVIYINTRDHNPPHFHIRMNDGREALVEIETMEMHSRGIAQREIKEALTWATENRDMLIAKIREYNP